MALTITTTDLRATGPRMYARVDDVRGNKKAICFELGFYPSEEAAKPPPADYETARGTFKQEQRAYPVFIKTFNFVPDVAPEAPNFWQQAYDWIKSQPESVLGFSVVG